METILGANGTIGTLLAKELVRGLEGLKGLKR